MTGDDLTVTLYDKTSESRLWRRVMIQAIKDASRGSPELMLDVAEWVRDGEDFDSVCHYSRIDPDFMAQALIDIMAMPSAARRVEGKALIRAILLRDADAQDDDSLPNNLIQ